MHAPYKLVLSLSAPMAMSKRSQKWIVDCKGVLLCVFTV